MRCMLAASIHRQTEYKKKIIIFFVKTGVVVFKILFYIKIY